MKLYTLDAILTNGKRVPLYRRESRAALETAALRLSDPSRPLTAIIDVLSAFVVCDRDEIVFSVVIPPYCEECKRRRQMPEMDGLCETCAEAWAECPTLTGRFSTFEQDAQDRLGYDNWIEGLDGDDGRVNQGPYSASYSDVVQGN